MSNRILPPVLWLIAALAAGPALAQVFYKSTMPDGRVVYGDKPAPGAVKVEETKPDISRQGIGGSATREAEALKAMQESRHKREAADTELRAAEDALRAAEARRAAGKDPLASERLGTAGGASRITDDYYKRQQKLDDDVEKARRALEKLRSGQ